MGSTIWISNPVTATQIATTMPTRASTHAKTWVAAPASQLVATMALSTVTTKWDQNTTIVSPTTDALTVECTSMLCRVDGISAMDLAITPPGLGLGSTTAQET